MSAEAGRPHQRRRGLEIQPRSIETLCEPFKALRVLLALDAPLRSSQSSMLFSFIDCSKSRRGQTSSLQALNKLVVFPAEGNHIVQMLASKTLVR